MAQNKSLPLPLAESQPRGSFNIRFQLQFLVSGAVIRCPGFVVAPGQVVTVKGVNGSVVNTHTAFIGESPEILRTTSAQVVLPNADVSVSYPVDNLIEIFAQGVAGDGLLITVQSPSVG